MNPENDIGNIEYKLKLLKTEDTRIDELTTQLRFRLSEGNGECFYIIGVKDNGVLDGISENDFIESFDNLKKIAKKNNCSVNIISKTNVQNDKFVYEIHVREINEKKYIDIKVAVAANADVGKCVSFDTPIIMYNGKIKMVQHIKKGDLLMGDDSQPRTVLETATGSGILYEIMQLNGDNYKVNKNHILCFKISCHNTICFMKKRKRFMIRWVVLEYGIPIFKHKYFPKKFSKEDVEKELQNKDKLKGGEIIELTLEQYINLPSNTQKALKLYKTGIEFPEKKVPIDPYIIGYWLGDGTSSKPEITTQDSTTVKYFKTNLEKYKCYFQYQNNTSEYTYRINGNSSDGNLFLKTLQNLYLIDNKHIPDIYKYNSRENRLKLLAGLLDSDGSYKKGRNIFEFSQSVDHEQLIDDVIYLCRSLGFACYKKKKNTHKGIKKNGEAFRFSIMGENIENIPTLCPRKKASKRISKKNVLVTAIKGIIPSEKKEKYFGFELDGNGRFLLGDFSVTHNSSLIGSLISGEKDNGRGLSRGHVFNYPHEFKTGRTSSIAHQILGFDHNGKITNYAGFGKPSWADIVQKSSKIISFFDLPGHEKYLHTTILGLASSFPDFCIIVIDGNNGIKPMTKEHIVICVTLKIPFIIVITKIDLCKDRKPIFDENMKGINKFLNYPGVRRVPINIKNNDDILTACKHLYSGNITPIFHVSNVTGEGIDSLKIFLNLIGKNKENYKKSNENIIEFHIDHIFNVYGFGTVIGGHLISGTVEVGDKLLIGPNNGDYEPIQIKSIYCKKIPMQKIEYGSYICIGVKKIERSLIKRGNVVISSNNTPLIVKEFKASISVLRTHSTTVKVGYEPILNAYAIRQVVKITEILDKKNARNIDDTDDDLCLRNGDSAIVKFKFKYRPQFLKVGTRFILCEGKTKIIGEVVEI